MILMPGYGLNYADMLSELSEIFSEAYDMDHKFWPCQPYGDEYAWIINRVLLAEELFGKKLDILDVGGGIGAVQWYLSRRKHNVKNVSRGINRLPLTGVDLISGDILDVNFGIVKYDVVIAASSIEHNDKEKIIEIINKIGSLLNRNGVLIMSYPVSEIGSWYPKGAWDKLPSADNTMVFDDKIENEIFGKVEMKRAFEESSTPWSELCNRARLIIKSTKGAKKLPYMSGVMELIKQ